MEDLKVATSKRVQELDRLRGEAWNAAVAAEGDKASIEYRGAMYQYMALTAMRDMDAEAFAEAVAVGNGAEVTFDWLRGYKD